MLDKGMLFEHSKDKLGEGTIIMKLVDHPTPLLLLMCYSIITVAIHDHYTSRSQLYNHQHPGGGARWVTAVSSVSPLIN